MKRKIIRQGIGGGTVYLPKKWLDQRGIKPGDEIEITETGEGLLLQSKSEPSKKKATVEVEKGDAGILEYIMFNHYNAGYDKLTIKGPVRQKAILDLLPFLNGFEMTSAKEGELTIEAISESLPEKSEVLMKQAFFILKEDMTHIMDSLNSQQPIDAEIIHLNVIRIGRIHNLLIRMGSKRVGNRSSFYWKYADLLFWMGVQMHMLAQALKGQKPAKMTAAQMAYVQSARTALDHIYNGVFNSSMKELLKVNNECVASEKKIYTLLTNQQEYPVAVMNHFSIVYRYMIYTAGAAIGMLLMEESP
jgi:bifunctional DNA-binding transcriptional regulator/antitoxin component of YhaV-PrlF toxin-antitoxin module